MSVVNRMLQDIDRRRTLTGVAANDNMDIHSVMPASDPSVRIIHLLVKHRAALIATGLLLASVAVIWHEWSARVEPVAEQVPVTEKISAVSSVSKLAPVVALALPEISTEARPNAEVLKLSLQLSDLLAAAPPANLPVKIAPTIRRPIAPAVLSTARDSSPTTMQTNIPVRQVAAEETIRVARILWGDGARPAALETLNEALASAEAARNNRATASLARELARLKVADNHARSALDLLMRLENLLGEDADSWALRANTEQRLALHAEAAESYLTALRLRPSEGKWMIGAAISLAAIGKQAEALVWVEQARERGAVTPTILVYLQQLGIAAH